MSDNTPEAIVSQARKHLLNIVSILKEGKLDSAVKAVVYGLSAYIKFQNVMIMQERKEYQELLAKAAHLISLDTQVKAVLSEPLVYTPKKEAELLAILRTLPELLGKHQAQMNQERQASLAQAREERLEKGRQLLQQKYFDGAVQHFKRMCDDYANDPELYAEIGKTLFDINHIECLTFLEKAVAANPEDHKSLAMLGVALRKTRKFDQAEQAYLQALKADNDNVGYLFNLSRVYIDAGNWQKAQETLRKVLTIDPSMEPARKGLEFATRNLRDLS